MPTRIILMASLSVMMFSSLSCGVFSSTFTSPLPPNSQKLSLEEASSNLGMKVPLPSYLPSGYEIQETYVTGEREVTVLISDEEIEKKLVSDGSTAEASKRYDIVCKIRMVIRWYPEGGAPVRLPVEKVEINESWGFLQDKGNYRALWWDLFPEQGKPAMFELVLAASKKISKEELTKIAKSVR